MPPITLRNLKVRLAVCAILVLVTGGCYSWHHTDAGHEDVITHMRPRQLRATMTDGTVLTLRDPMLVGDTIVGASSEGPARAPALDLHSLEVLRFSPTRTAALVGLHVATVVGIIAAVIYVQPHYYGF